MRKKNKGLIALKNVSSGGFFKGGDIAFVVLLIISLIAMITILSLAMQYSSGMNDQAVLISETYSEDVNSKFRLQIDAFRERTSALALPLQGPCGR